MTYEQALAVLKHHQQWRRGADIPMQEPSEIGEALDVAINLLKQHKWNDGNTKPPKYGWYLVKLQWKLEEEQDYSIIPITAYYGKYGWTDDHIESYEGDGYSEPIILAWREIHE